VAQQDEETVAASETVAVLQMVAVSEMVSVSEAASVSEAVSAATVGGVRSTDVQPRAGVAQDCAASAKPAAQPAHPAGKE
jgi:hypothetical protein